MRQINLLVETVAKLKLHGKTASDILWCGSDAIGWFTWDDFSVIACTTDYDCGYGANQIPINLVIMGKDFWLERFEYDGSEWWEFRTPIKKPEKYYKPKSLIRWELIEELERDIA